MEVTALSNRLLLNVLLLLAEHCCHSCAQKADAAFLRIAPTRLQFFEYESIVFTCEGFDDGSAKWRGVRNAEGFIPTCSNGTATSTVTCTLYNAFETDSGEYWCEAGGGERSNTVNIIVTVGSVILESPVLPAIEGDNVTLCCRRKVTLNHTADFYKDGLQFRTGYSGKIVIHNVSKSDEGLYKCNISGAGESPVIRMTVMNNSFTIQKEDDSVILESPIRPVMEGDAVVLSCRNNTSSASLPAVFYKDGLFIGSSSTGNMTIHYVYQSHEGLYMCNISEVGQSKGSWLAVRALHKETSFCSDHFVLILLLLRTVFTIVMVALLLLLVGLLHCGKLTVTHK